jgi:SAUR family protein
MGILRATDKKNIGILKLRVVAEKLQKSLSLGWKEASKYRKIHEYHGKCSPLPKDVKVGHFAVIAIENGDPKRFVVPLSYLNHPRFLVLLEEAAEEFGFGHEGALSIPCQWREVEKLLASDN